MQTDQTWEQFEDAAKRAHNDIIEYAKRAEAIFGKGVCTYNLHTIACRGLMQELANGPLSREKDMWLERLLQMGKQKAKNRARNKAEAVLVNDLMDVLGMKRTKTKYPMLRTWEEALQPSSTVALPPIDFRGAPIRIGDAALTTMRTRITQHWAVFYRDDDTGWASGHLQYADMLLYHHCIVQCIGRRMTLSSQSYKRTAATALPYVLVTYDYDGAIQHYVARVEVFLKVAPPPGTQLQPLYLAVADVFGTRPVALGDAHLLEVPNMDATHPSNWHSYPVKVSDIREPLIQHVPDASHKGYFIFDDPDEDP